MPTRGPRDRPVPLLVAGGLVVLQGLVLLVYAVLEAASVSSGRVTMGVTTAAFFAAYGAALAGCGLGLARARRWARSPTVLAQLIWLGVAWSFRGGATSWVALVLVATAAVVLVCVFLPASTALLTEDDG
ncbi:MAG TPA: hypothetical protein PLP61_04510 [Nocardioides sp.]|uniref:hypothetical protein n=1 Tax=Nocardioides sp. TaxID=35761 RepID=UPI002D1B2D97|nr:hypothetical protein [Nocardioides sp.]HQR26281.1 hypothetical protein [Nocardioides sp.]